MPIMFRTNHDHQWVFNGIVSRKWVTYASSHNRVTPVDHVQESGPDRNMEGSAFVDDVVITHSEDNMEDIYSGRVPFQVIFSPPEEYFPSPHSCLHSSPKITKFSWAITPNFGSWTGLLLVSTLPGSELSLWQSEYRRNMRRDYLQWDYMVSFACGRYFDSEKWIERTAVSLSRVWVRFPLCPPSKFLAGPWNGSFQGSTLQDTTMSVGGTSLEPFFSRFNLDTEILNGSSKEHSWYGFW